jgi:hypothetical protein
MWACVHATVDRQVAAPHRVGFRSTSSILRLAHCFFLLGAKTVSLSFIYKRLPLLVGGTAKAARERTS